MLELPVPLTTPRMTLRCYESRDLEGLHDLYRREDVCRYLPWEPMDIDQARAKLEQRLRQTRIQEDGDPIVLAAIDTASGRMIGEFMLRLSNAETGQGEVGWCLNPDVHGRGLATEGGQEMLRLGFDELGLHRIVAGTDPRNEASVRVMERLGMRHEALLVESDRVKGEWVGEVVCAMLEPEWRSRTGAVPPMPG